MTRDDHNTTNPAPSALQATLARLPDELEPIVLDGGRGGGKSWPLAELILKHLNQTKQTETAVRGEALDE